MLIISNNELYVDNSTLTGETEAQARSTTHVHTTQINAHNMCFYGTYATKGTATCLAVHTGDKTAIGNIATLVSTTKVRVTPLRRDFDRFIKSISAVAIIEGLICLIVSCSIYNKPNQIINNFVAVIAIIVANIPQALMPAVTAVLTVTAKRMKNKHVMVKNLEAVETLGSSTTICSDKTGTLTQNRMTVSHLWHDNHVFSCDTNANENRQDFDVNSETFKKLYACAAICNNATFLDENEVIAKRKVSGDASETALLRFCEKIKSVSQVRGENPELYSIPFNSTNKWQIQVHHDTANQVFKIYMKGAPERVSQYCETQPEQFDETIVQLSSYGERILGFSELVLTEDDIIVQHYLQNTLRSATPSDLNLPRNNMKFIGLMSLIDPPKEGVPEAVLTCIEAGVRVIMVTGDHPETAKAIAKQVNIIQVDHVATYHVEHGAIKQENVDAPAAVITGDAIPHLTNNDWNHILQKRQIVFARTSPEQKLVIVGQCQKRGEFVAVTGDGVNDSPALKKADIGIAMGIGGSDVSKEAANMILMDDNFASIVHAVAEGRLIFDNLKKAIAYVISHNLAELCPLLAGYIFGFPLPLSTLMMLSIDIAIDTIPAILLAYEPAESEIMKRPPRKSSESLVPKQVIFYSYAQAGVVVTLAGFYSYFVVMASYGFTPNMLPFITLNGSFMRGAAPITNALGQVFNEQEQLEVLKLASSAYFVAVIASQWGNMLACKTRRLSLFRHSLGLHTIFGYALQLALICLFIYCPGINTAFFAAPLPFKNWLTGIPFGILLFVMAELKKMISRASDDNTWINKHIMW
jgi:sodium/potassium uptake antiporter P-type ATPase alpha subunit